MLYPTPRYGDTWEIIHDWLSEATQAGEAICSFCGAVGLEIVDALVPMPKILGEPFLKEAPDNWEKMIYAVPVWCVQCHHMDFFRADQELIDKLFIEYKE